MKLRTVALLVLAVSGASACGGSDDANAPGDGDASMAGDGDGDLGGDSGGASEPALVVDEIAFDFEEGRMLTSLTDEEIRGACEEMAEVFDDADAGVACQIVAAAEGSVEACEASRDACLVEPADALEQTSVRSAPAPVDCSAFDSSLTESCDFPVSLLEDCVNSLAQSVVPAAQAVHCEEAAEIESVEDAQSLATGEKGTEFASICMDLLACEALVEALLVGSN